MARAFAQSCAVPFAVLSITVLVGLRFVDGGSVETDENEASANEGSENPGVVISEDDMVRLIPPEWQVMRTERQSRGWHQMGRIRMGLEDAMNEVSRLMSEVGYAVRLQEPADMEDADKSNVLIEYSDRYNRGRVVWALWRQSGNQTGFSWGIPK